MALFATLGRETCERIARAAADVSLMPGEYAAHEGDERALFAVLEGRIEAVKLVDGIESGRRAPPGATLRRGADHARDGLPGRLPRRRASRVMRIEPHDYHADRRRRRPTSARRSAAGRAPDRRIGGLQGIAAEPPPPRAIVVGHRWDARLRASCGASSTATRSPSRWLTPDAPDAARAVGRRRCPPRRTARRSASSTARRSCGRSCAGSPSCSASRPSRPPPSTTP